MSAVEPRARRRTPLALAAYALLAVASFWPQLAHAWDAVAYVGDGVESVYLVAWNVHQFFRDPLRLFDANVFYPSRHALAFTDHRLLPSLLVAPVVWATGNPVLATNVAVLLACLLAAYAARRLALALGVSEAAAFAAGALYAFHTYEINEASRLNILFHGFLPLALEACVRYLRSGERVLAWRSAGLLLLQGLSSNYHLLYGALLIGLVVLLALLLSPRTSLSRLPALAGAGVVAALLFLPVAWPYLAVARSHGYARPLPVSMGIEHYWSTISTNLVYGELGAEIRTQQRGPHFTGFLPVLLAALSLGGFFLGRRPDDGELLPARAWVPLAALLFLLFALFSLGRNVVLEGRYLSPGPYQLLYHYVPGFQQVRIPERLSLLAMLFLSLLAARGLTLLGGRLPPQAVWLLAALVPLEHLSPQPESPRLPVGRDVPEVYRYLAKSDARAVAELPIHGEGLVREETLEMYFSTVHWKPIIHGYTAYPPLVTRLLRRAAAQFPAEVALQAFARVGVDAVVVHHGLGLGADLLRQVPGRGEEKQERFQRLLRLAGLDLYGQLGPALEAGRIRREARFDGPAARLFRSTRDEVYRIAPAERRAAARFPAGPPLSDRRWRYVAATGEPGLAGDGDPATAWVTIDPLAGDETFEVAFPSALHVGGLVLPLRWDTPFPTRFRVDGRGDDGLWKPLARYDEAQVLQLLDRVLEDPSRAAIGFDLGDRELFGVRLAVEAGGTSFDGWAIPELQILAPERR